MKDIKIGDKVYMWDFYKKDVATSVCAPHEPIIGTVIGFDPHANDLYNCVKIESLLDGWEYRPRLSHVFRVGEGPSAEIARKEDEVVYEDYYV